MGFILLLIAFLLIAKGMVIEGLLVIIICYLAKISNK